MILYTIVPYNVIFGFGSEIYSQIFEIEYLGEKVQVYSLKDNEYIINRVVSTSPKAFLKPELQPGTVIKAGFNSSYDNKGNLKEV
jgi:hypothetical protein